jgi:chromosome segregation ATPase
MKRLLLMLLAGCVALPLAVLFIVPGCGPRAEVAKKKALERLDDVLGKIDVQRQEIDGGIKATKRAVEGVRKARIKAQVQCDQLDEKLKPHDERIARCDQTLSRLRDLLKAGKPAEVAGKTYSVSDLSDMAGKLIEERKNEAAQINGVKASRARMQKVVAELTKTQQTLEARLGSLQSQVAKLDAEMAAAKAMKEASASMGDGEATLAANLDGLEEKVAALSADVRAELKGEEEKFQVARADKAIGDVDHFIRDSQKPTDRVAEIDKILDPAKK